MRKQSSTNSLNERFLAQTCELNTALNIIGGRWKAQLIYEIGRGVNRFSLLKEQLSNISDQVLGRQLRELEEQEIIVKEKLEHLIPVGIVYSLTEQGILLYPVLESLCQWGKIYTSPKPKCPLQMEIIND
ncbi:helix-turn-helix domain-containing protein [Xanthocytophaga agilis]|uniref:Helix-turn-helix domain-containing protein n=1 Tax=Xanthocytophaga agilis TaxID=3048010 RepID=A0AAE3R5C6_9BACT|nr:helix-turn-helix domain-containing protein [Xanthocytophaga agilis]MDJ1504221.1 helix-turn-helix domain-containing protein [Xanthocytophaga agilis]